MNRNEGFYPNGGTKENCVVLKPGAIWQDINCQYRYGVGCSCTRTPLPYLQLRGLSSSSGIDTLYLTLNDQVRLVYAGSSDTTVQYDLQHDFKFKGQASTRELKLTSCTEGNFSCDDGKCGKMEERCDQVLDCRDKSDEVNCNILVLEKSYRKSVPPIS